MSTCFAFNVQAANVPDRAQLHALSRYRGLMILRAWQGLVNGTCFPAPSRAQPVSKDALLAVRAVQSKESTYGRRDALAHLVSHVDADPAVEHQSCTCTKLLQSQTGTTGMSCWTDEQTSILEGSTSRTLPNYDRHFVSEHLPCILDICHLIPY